MTRSILAVDDSKTMRDMVSFTLKSAGFDVELAENGKSALQVLADRDVDLVITDINMPEMNGIDLVKSLRSHPTMRAKPILILTTETDGDLKQKGKEVGATGWIVKPFDPDKLLAVVNKVCPT